MSKNKLTAGAETIINQCLDIKADEDVLVVNDSNDQGLIDILLAVLKDKNIPHELVEYEEPDKDGEEPPNFVAEKIIEVDVVIAPTKKSISHTEARKQANKSGARIATLPGINRQIWSSALQADYNKVKEITEQVYDLLSSSSKVKVETPSGTDLSFDIEIDTYHKDTGIITDSGDFGNLPAGEPNGYPANISGTLVIDHFLFSPSAKKVEIEDEHVVSIKNEKKAETSKLKQAFKNLEGAKQLAEFGFGTNPEAELIGSILQDEKVLGSVHFAFGDNCSYVDKGDDRRNPCDIHWDSVCKDPTVYFDDKKILDRGSPIFLKE